MVDVKKERRRGRPPSFDRDTVLDRAMEVFWARGYEGASITMLTSAMTISAQSLYAAFGSKEALYQEAVARYRVTIGAFADRALNGEPDVVEAIARLLRESVALFTLGMDAPGCMVTNAPNDLIDEPLMRFGRQLRADGERSVADRLRRGMRDGQLRADTNCDAWARYLLGVLQGLTIQARDGMATQALLETADIALRSVRFLIAEPHPPAASGRPFV